MDGGLSIVAEFRALHDELARPSKPHPSGFRAELQSPSYATISVAQEADAELHLHQAINRHPVLRDTMTPELRAKFMEKVRG